MSTCLSSKTSFFQEPSDDFVTLLDRDTFLSTPVLQDAPIIRKAADFVKIPFQKLQVTPRNWIQKCLRHYWLEQDPGFVHAVAHTYNVYNHFDFHNFYKPEKFQEKADRLCFVIHSRWDELKHPNINLEDLCESTVMLDFLETRVYNRASAFTYLHINEVTGTALNSKLYHPRNHVAVRNDGPCPMESKLLHKDYVPSQAYDTAETYGTLVDLLEEPEKTLLLTRGLAIEPDVGFEALEAHLWE